MPMNSCTENKRRVHHYAVVSNMAMVKTNSMAMVNNNSMTVIEGDLVAAPKLKYDSSEYGWCFKARHDSGLWRSFSERFERLSCICHRALAGA